MKSRKSWKEKLMDSRGLPRVEEVDEEMRLRWGSGTMVIPAPIEVDALMRRVPGGTVTTINEIRAVLARRHGASFACPITTGIFSWIAAHAAEEDLLAGEKQVTPYWRTLKSGGELNPKYPGGVEHLAAKLEAEGIPVLRKGKKYVVPDFEKRLAKLDE